MEAGRKTLLTKAGDTERYLYFVVEGIQRIYYSKPDGKEATLVFSYAPSFTGVVDSLLLQQPSRYCMETLTQSRFLRAHVQQWQQLGRRSLFDVMGAEADYYSLRVAQINALYDAQQAVAVMGSMGRGVTALLR